MSHFDAIIVGARCAGSTTAYYLAKSGYNVLLLDRNLFPSDVMSTHTIFNNTVAVLREMGVLDELLKTDTPPVRGMNFYHGGNVIDGDMPETHGESYTYCFRRTHFDHILLKHAEQNGVMVKTGFRVTDLLWEDGTVVGVKGRDRNGNESEYRSKIVIGADGRVSTVRSLAGSEEKFALPTQYGAYFGYFHNFPAHPDARLELIRVGIYKGAIFPTSDGQHVLTAFFPNDDTDLIKEFQQDPEGKFRSFMHTHLAGSSIGPRLDQATLAEPLKGILHFDNNWFQGMGPGWALVGDAISFKDPGMGQGMHDAIFGGRILAQTLSANSDWSAVWSEMAEQYQTAMENEFMVRFRMCCQISQVTEATEEELAMDRAIGASAQATQAFFGIFNYANEPDALEAALKQEEVAPSSSNLVQD